MTQTAMPSGIIPDGSFFERARFLRNVTSNRVEAELLEHIMFWSEKGGYRDRTGTRWLIRTAQEFAAHVDWSISTIYKALRRLVAKGLIEIKHSWHRYAGGKFHCTYVRPILDRIAQAVIPSEVTPEVTSKCPQRSLPYLYTSQHSAVPAMPAASPDDDELKTEEEPQEGAEEAPTQQAILPVPSFSEIRAVDKSEPAPRRTLADLFAEQKSKPLTRPAPGKVLNAEGVHQELRFHHKASYQLEQPPELNAIRRKWLKQFLERVRAVNCTDDEIRTMVERVVCNWDGFRGWLKDRSGFHLKEARPTHHAFMMQAVEMVNFLRLANVGTMAVDDDALPEGTSSLADMMKGEPGGNI